MSSMDAATKMHAALDLAAAGRVPVGLIRSARGRAARRRLTDCVAYLTEEAAEKNVGRRGGPRRADRAGDRCYATGRRSARDDLEGYAGLALWRRIERPVIGPRDDHRERTRGSPERRRVTARWLGAGYVNGHRRHDSTCVNGHRPEHGRPAKLGRNHQLRREQQQNGEREACPSATKSNNAHHRGAGITNHSCRFYPAGPGRQPRRNAELAVAGLLPRS